MIRNKLKSRQGASLSMSLLVFLVCALASSVVLVAATASAGRLSNLAKMDQRYYAVNSAADLIRSVIEQNPTVTVVDTSVITTTTTIEEGVTEPKVTVTMAPTSYPSQFYVAANPASSTPGSGEGTTDPIGGTSGGEASAVEPAQILVADTSSYLLTEVAKSLADAEETEAEAKGKTASAEETPGGGTPAADPSADVSPAPPKLGTIHLGEGEANPAQQVEVYREYQQNGTLTYYISQKQKDADNNPIGEYTLKMIFEADIRHNTVTHTDYGVPQLVPNATDTAKKDKQTVDTETITTTTTYTWHLTDVVKSRVPTSPPTGEGSGGEGSGGSGS